MDGFIQIGVTAARDPATGAFLPAVPLYQEVMTLEGRKNGKTTEMSAVEIDLLVNDGEGSPQVYNVATKRDQAMLGFNACLAMIKRSEDLAAILKKRVSDIYFAYNLGIIKALASNSNGLDGLNASGVIIDELAAIKNRDLYDLMKQSMSARAQPLLFAITTNGFIRDNTVGAGKGNQGVAGHTGRLHAQRIDRGCPADYPAGHAGCGRLGVQYGRDGGGIPAVPVVFLG